MENIAAYFGSMFRMWWKSSSMIHNSKVAQRVQASQNTNYVSEIAEWLIIIWFDVLDWQNVNHAPCVSWGFTSGSQ